MQRDVSAIDELLVTFGGSYLLPSLVKIDQETLFVFLIWLTPFHITIGPTLHDAYWLTYCPVLVSTSHIPSLPLSYPRGNYSNLIAYSNSILVICQQRDMYVARTLLWRMCRPILQTGSMLGGLVRRPRCGELFDSFGWPPPMSF